MSPFCLWFNIINRQRYNWTFWCHRLSVERLLWTFLDPCWHRGSSHLEILGGHSVAITSIWNHGHTYSLISRPRDSRSFPLFPLLVKNKSHSEALDIFWTLPLVPSTFTRARINLPVCRPPVNLKWVYWLLFCYLTVVVYILYTRLLLWPHTRTPNTPDLDLRSASVVSLSPPMQPTLNLLPFPTNYHLIL